MSVFGSFSGPLQRPTHRHHLALGRHECGAVADAQLGLQRVEVDLQLALLLHFGGLVEPAVVPEVLQLPLHLGHGLLRRAVLQPRRGAPDPLQQLPQRQETWRPFQMFILLYYIFKIKYLRLFKYDYTV